MDTADIGYASIVEPALSGFFCNDCGIKFEDPAREGEFHNAPCPSCGELSATVNRPNSYFVRFVPYFDNAFGKMVHSSGEKQRLVKEHGLVEIGGEFKKHVQGKTFTPQWKSPVTTAEVAEKLKEVRARIGHAPESE